jgi:hypothetical protein
MKRYRIGALIAIVVVALMAPQLHAQQKLAQTGFQFLSLSTDARAAAMGDAFTAVNGGSSNMFYNPACIALQTQTIEMSISQMKWIADINYFGGGVIFRPSRGAFGVFGLSFTTVDYGDFLGTMVAENEKGYEDTGTFSPSSMAIGLSYANQLTDRFSIGGTVKWARQDLGSHSVISNPALPREDLTDGSLVSEGYQLDVAAFDFGTYYRTGFKSLAFGMSVRNFSQEVEYETEGFQLPLTFKIGFSIDALDFLPGKPNGHSLLLAVDAAHPRSFPEYFSIGGEYTLLDVLSLRAGYVGSQDEYGLSAGFGVQKFGMGIHYAYSPFSMFNDVNRLTVQVSL